jgi:hypothetical protein
MMLRSSPGRGVTRVLEIVTAGCGLEVLGGSGASQESSFDTSVGSALTVAGAGFRVQASMHSAAIATPQAMFIHADLACQWEGQRMG